MNVLLDNIGRYGNIIVKGGFIFFVVGLFNIIGDINNILYVFM